MTLGNLAVSSGTVNSLLLYANIYSIYGVAYKQFAIAKGQNANRSHVITFAVIDHQLSLLYTQLFQVLTKTLSQPLM